MRNLIDSLFKPPLEFLSYMSSSLRDLGTVAARGYDLNVWFGWIAILGDGFKVFIFSLLGSLTLLTVLYNIKTFSRLLIWFKELIGRWT